MTTRSGLAALAGVGVVALLLLVVAARAQHYGDADDHDQYEFEYEKREAPPEQPKSKYYYTMVDAIVARRSFYTDVLGVAADADKSELASAFRKLSRQYHPDKVARTGADPKEAEERFAELNTAKAILLDDKYRAEYDALLRDGVPFGDRYARGLTLPKFSVVWPIVIFFALLSAIKHWYLVYDYNNKHADARRHPVYIRKLRLAQTAARAAGEPLPTELALDGLVLPTWRDLLLWDIVLLPYAVGAWCARLARYLLWWRLCGQMPSDEWFEEQTRVAHDMSHEEWAAYKADLEERKRAFRLSNRGKRMARYKKNHVPVGIMPDTGD